jgi:ribokinase
VKVAVVGHVECIEFVPVERAPLPGEIVQAGTPWEECGGGGAVAALQLARLAGAATLYTALGDDELGRRAKQELEEQGVRVIAAWRAEPQRRGFVFVDSEGERTITVIGPKHSPRAEDPIPWGELDEVDAVYYTARDVTALRQARRARVLVATARELPTLREAGVELDALVHSGKDPGERYEEGSLQPPPRLVVTTRGGRGGTYTVRGGESATFPAAERPGPRVDDYGAGDCFAAGLAYGLVQERTVEDALALASACGAAATTGPGVHVGYPPAPRDA